MKYIFLTAAVVILFIGEICGQNNLPSIPYIKSNGFTLQSEWQLQDGQLQLLPVGIDMGDTIAINLSSQDGDVVIKYDLPLPERNHDFDFGLKIKIGDDVAYSIPLENYMLKLTEMTKKRTITTQIWTGVLDRFSIYPNDKLTINLLVKDVISLPEPPEFTLKQKRPYFSGMAIGTGLVIAGAIIKQDADNIYEEKYLTQFFSDPAEPYFKEANDKRKQSQVLLYSGGAVIATSAILYFTRRKRYLDDKREYESFQRLIQPSLTFQGDGKITPGFSLVYTF